jgi:hypothetical protein
MKRSSLTMISLAKIPGLGFGGTQISLEQFLQARKFFFVDFERLPDPFVR